MTLIRAQELIRCSPINGCGQLKPRTKMARCGQADPLCMACYQRARRLLQSPAEIRRANLWAKYRITPEQYDALRAEQNYRCGVCGTKEADIDLTRVGGRPRSDGQPLLKVPLAVDHDHRTRAIRGLLCPSCNAGLGAFGDDPNRLYAAIAYLNNAWLVVRRPDPGAGGTEAEGCERAS
ncbi:endonuclease VII domain-containing protein [Mycobacterium sp. UM_CSW]|uniref:endonuclease VII domain-containing protein n=1 Tax=Mycobacterium sp. UM_CSW TaxID=1370119 RepID=UPI00137672BA|nr:endonuclease VII domain-containing protein [Mycobacterium sp. UM_CSW]